MVQFIFDFLNMQDEPFDGFMSFSQGVYMMSSIFKIQRYFSKQHPLKHRMPFFVVDFSGPMYASLTYKYTGDRFVSSELFIPGIESLHFFSKADNLYQYMKNHFNYEKPIFILHD